MRTHRAPGSCPCVGTDRRAHRTAQPSSGAGRRAVARIQSRAHRGYRSNLSLSVLRRICHRPNSPPPASIRLFITALETCRFLGTLCLPCIVFWRSRARRHARRQSSHPMGHISDMRGEFAAVSGPLAHPASDIEANRKNGNRNIIGSERHLIMSLFPNSGVLIGTAARLVSDTNVPYESDPSGASFSPSSTIDRPTVKAILFGIFKRTGP